MNYRALDNPNKKIPSIPYTFLVWVLFVYFIMMIFEAPVNELVYSFSISVLCMLLILLNINLIPFKQIAALCIFGVLILISSTVNASGREFMCNLLSLLSLMMLNSRLRLLSIALMPLYVFEILLGVLLLLCAPLGDMTSMIISNDFLSNLNPNTSAFYMAMLYMVSISFAYFSDRKIRFIAVAIFSAVAVVLFKARTSLLGILIFTFFVVLFKFVKCSRKSTAIFYLCILGVVFAYVYSVLLYEWIGPGKIIILGKDLFTGRNLIWSAAFKQIKGHYLLGIGNTLADAGEDAAYTYNFHNQFVAILTMYGVPVLVLFSLCYMKFSNKITDNKELYHILLAFNIALVVMCYLETFMQSTRLFILIVIAMAITICRATIALKEEEKC